MNKRMTTFVFVGLGGVAAFLIWGRARTPTTPLIVYVAPTLANPFFVQMKEGADAAAAAHGFQLVFQAPAGGVEDAAAQVDLVEALLARKPAALCVVPADSKGILPAIEAANRAGVPVINVDNRIDSSAAAARGVTVTTYIGSNNRLGGRLAGDFIVTQLGGKGRVALLEGLLGSDAAIQRATGFRDALAAAPGIQLVATETASWSREQGLNKFLGILQAHPNVDAVFAANDEMALGVIAALHERGSARQKSHVMVVGFDATPDGLKAIEAGDMAATVAQQPVEMGKLCIDAAAKVLQKQSVPSMVPVPVVLRTGSPKGAVHDSAKVGTSK